MSSNNKSGLRSIAERLRRHDNTNSSPTAGELGTNRAAVLICLFQGKDGHLRVILTQRSSTISSHSGEVALPGGKWEEGDDTHAATALREANEEIGLDPSIVEIVSILPPFYTKVPPLFISPLYSLIQISIRFEIDSNLHFNLQRHITVFPVIGIIWDISSFSPILNPSEVESVFDAPLEMFLKVGYYFKLIWNDFGWWSWCLNNVQNEKRREEKVELLGERYLLHYFDHETENRCYTIWALTASILIKAASIIYQRPPAFEEHKPTFWGRSRHWTPSWNILDCCL